MISTYDLPLYRQAFMLGQRDGVAERGSGRMAETDSTTYAFQVLVLALRAWEAAGSPLDPTTNGLEWAQGYGDGWEQGYTARPIPF